MKCIDVQKGFEAIGFLFRPSSCTWYLMRPSESEIEALCISVILKYLITALNKMSKCCVVTVRFYTETSFVIAA